jgi:hypothetical protein
MTTAFDILTRHGLTPAADDLDDIAADLAVPVLSGPQRQGDILIVPTGPLTPAERATAAAVPAGGVALVRGEATGNTHILAPDPGVSILWAETPAGRGDTLLGVIAVDGGPAWLIHTDEHSVLGVAPGVYQVRGKREQREEIARVQD